MSKYEDVTRAVLDKIRPKILEQMEKSNAFYNHYKGGLKGMSENYSEDHEYLHVSSGYSQNSGGAPLGQFTISTTPISTTQLWTTQTLETGNKWYWPAATGPQGMPTVLPAPPVEPEPPAEIAPVERPRGRMIKLGSGKKR